MDTTQADIDQDIRRIAQIPIVPNLLDVICQTTGMGFAAIARVTETRWVTCSVRDDIQFGLVPGSELSIKTTICDEIRDSGQPVVIEHVEQDETFCLHHTPLQYGFQSYISYPIFLKSGAFFGTLCAIDPKPAELDNSKVRGLFAAFSDLISFHLQQVELLEKSHHNVKNLSRQLTDSQDENRQYRHVSSHTLQEPLRRLRTFSDMLLDAIRRKELDQAEQYAIRIGSGAQRFTNLIKNLAEYANLDNDRRFIQPVDLEAMVNIAHAQLHQKMLLRKATLMVSNLPTIVGIPDQLEQLFYHLFDNAIKFAKEDVPLELVVHSRSSNGEHTTEGIDYGYYVEILVSDNGIGIPESQLEVIFDMFSQLAPDPVYPGNGIGLSLCRKIVRNHSGQISISSEENVGTTVSLILPVEQVTY